ncbi:MAG: hypothetical protein ACOCWA_03465 [Bacteroidota bacterium]
MIKISLKSECAAKGFWGGLNKKIVDYFKSISLEDLLHNEAILDDVS